MSLQEPNQAVLDQRMWNVVKVFLLLATVCAQGGHGKEGQEAQTGGHVSVVIVGGTGDLAKKYLWQGFFQLYTSQVSSGYTFSFYGGGLSPSDKATPILFEFLKGVSCSRDLSPERCALLKDQFLRLAQYRHLKTIEDYQALDQHIKQQLQEEGMVEAGRLFYLSVPAFAYADIADKINVSCRPAAGAWLRVVLEKPFGHDFTSAQILATQLGNSLKDEEMYRIDHYLGKQVMEPCVCTVDSNTYSFTHLSCFISFYGSLLLLQGCFKDSAIQKREQEVSGSHLEQAPY